MKNKKTQTIVTATDFSPVSARAVAYAAALAKRSGANLAIVHAIHPPVALGEVNAVVPFYADMRDCAERRLRRIVSSLKTRNGEDLRVEYFITVALAGDAIGRTVTDRKADMVVLGVNSAGRFSEKWLGSVSTAFIRNSSCPVLCIRGKHRFHHPRKIALAVTGPDYTVPEQLDRIADEWKAEIHPVHVVKPGQRRKTTATKKRRQQISTQSVPKT